MCRAIVRDEHGQPLIYNSVPGELSVTFNEDIPNPIEVEIVDMIDITNHNTHSVWATNIVIDNVSIMTVSIMTVSIMSVRFLTDVFLQGKMYLVVNTDDLIYALKPQYICMTGVDEVCTVNEFPVAYPRTIRPATKG